MTVAALTSPPSVVVPPAELDVAVLLGGVASDDIFTEVTTGSITVAADDFLVVTWQTRAGPTHRTHDSLTPTGWACTFTRHLHIFETDTLETHRSSMWTGIVTSGGSGILTATSNAGTYQQGVRVLRVPGGTSVQAMASGANATGTTVTATWDVAPDPDGLTVAAALTGANSAIALGGSHTAITDFATAIGSGFQIGGWQKLLSPASPLAFTNMVNNKAHIGMGLQIVGT